MTPKQLLDATQGSAIPGYTLTYKVVNETKMLFIYVDSANDMVIAFGGTRLSFKDWLLNLEINPVHGYHGGAYDEVAELLAEIMHVIHVFDPRHIQFAGHSQGGAHAVIAAELVHGPLASVTTFGALPALASTTTQPPFNVVNYLHRIDPMAWVPWGFFGLKYAGIVKKLGKPSLFPDPAAHNPMVYATVLS